MTADTARVAARLDAIEAAHAAATVGPWVPNGHEVVPGAWGDSPPLVARTNDVADATAIVAAHNNVPWLCAAVRGVLALADELESFTVNRNPAPGSYDAGVVAAFVNVAARIRDALDGGDS